MFELVEKYAVKIERKTAIQTITAVSKISLDSIIGDCTNFFITDKIENVRVRVMKIEMRNSINITKYPIHRYENKIC
jgi:hypothetical protein